MSEYLRGLDHYLTTDRRDAEPPSAPAKYACRDCGWTGRAIKSFDHHRRTGHRILVAGMDVPFSCCALDRCVKFTPEEQAERCPDCGCESCVCE